MERSLNSLTRNKDSLSQEWQVQEKRREAPTTCEVTLPSYCDPWAPRSRPLRGRQTTNNPLDWSNAQMNVLQHAKETAPQTGTRCLGLRKCFVLHTRRYPTQIALQHAQDIILIVIFAGTNRLHHIQRIRGSIQSSTLASLRLFLRIPDHSNRRSEDGTIMHEITKYYRESPDLALVSRSFNRTS